MTSETISVVIPTKNRFHDIIKCIESILVQTLLPDEIVIVDSSDTEEIKSKLDNLHHDKITFRYIHIKTGSAKARNIGTNESIGDIIVFLDDDVILDKDYIKEIMHIFNNDLEKKIGGVTGNIMNNTKTQNRSFKHLIGHYIMRILGTVFLLSKYGNGKFQPSGYPTFAHGDKITPVECLFGANMAFRREIFNEFKFDENLQGYSYMEDDDLAYRTSRKYQNIYTPFAKLVHNVSPAARDKEYARMKMTIENSYYLFKKNFPQTFKHKIAFWWSVVGLFVGAVINRNKEGLKGLIGGIISIRKEFNFIKNVYKRFQVLKYKRNVERYWDSEAEYLKDLHDKTANAYFDVISPYISSLNVRSLLEIGYGTGRLYPLYKEIDTVVGIDVSGKLLKLAEPHSNLTLIKAKAEDVAFPENSFDLILTCKTLAHIPKENIEKVVEKMCRFSRKYILIVETSRLNQDGTDWSGSTSFRHDYKNLFENRGMKLIDRIHLFKHEPRTELFLFKKEVIQ